jgi:Ala-tRNA(Pro) deacylase
MKPTARKIKHYLDKSGINYWTTDSWSIDAASSELTDQNFAVEEVVRCLLVKIEGQHAVVALGSLEEFDLDEMREFLQTDAVEVAGDAECRRLFPDCDATAIPALGNVCGMPVYCSHHVLKNQSICFNSGTHEEIIRLATKDFIKLAQPIVGNFARSGVAGITAAYYW